MQVCATSTTVKPRSRILQTSLLCFTLSWKNCLTLQLLCAVGNACVSLPQTFDCFFSCRARACLAAMNPQYFEYQIDRGVEWIRIYSPGIWRPVPDDAPVLDPLHASTYREWRRSYRFQGVLVRRQHRRHNNGSHSHAQFLCVLPCVGVPRLANTRVSTTWSSCTSHWTRDARECRRQFLGGLIGTGWGVAGAVAATIL